MLGRLLTGEAGQDLIEYALLASLVSIVSVVAITNLGRLMQSVWAMICLIGF